jgi:DNA polymerase-4
MAKLAGEAKKPDGLTVVLPGEEIKFLDRFKLADACGIGTRIETHLNCLGIHTFKQLRETPQTNLTLIFKSYGLRLYNMARGIDSSPVLPYFMRPEAKSISRSKTLPRDTWDKDLIAKMALSFCQNIAAELRQKSLLAGGIGIYLRYKDFSHAGQGKMIKVPTKDTIVLYKSALKILRNLPTHKAVRKIGIWAGRLTPDPQQEILFEDYKRPLILESIADSLNKKYPSANRGRAGGQPTVTRASLVNLGFSGQAPSFGFKKDINV